MSWADSAFISLVAVQIAVLWCAGPEIAILLLGIVPEPPEKVMLTWEAMAHAKEVQR